MYAFGSTLLGTIPLNQGSGFVISVERRFAPNNKYWTFLSITFKVDDQQGDCKFAAPLLS